MAKVSTPVRYVPWCLLGALALSYASVARTVELPWSIIDDPLFLRVARVLDADWRSGDVRGLCADLWGYSSSRVAPAFYAAMWLRSSVGGENAGRLHAVRIVELMLSVALLYLLFRKVTGSDCGAGIAAAFVAAGPGATENWTRLCTSEPHLVFIQALALIALLTVGRTRSRLASGLLVTGAVLVTLAASLTKAVAIFAVVPGLMACFSAPKYGDIRSRIPSRRLWIAYSASIAATYLATRMIAHALGSAPDEYVSQYALDVSRIAANVPRLLTLALGACPSNRVWALT